MTKGRMMSIDMIKERAPLDLLKMVECGCQTDSAQKNCTCRQLWCCVRRNMARHGKASNINTYFLFRNFKRINETCRVKLQEQFNIKELVIK